MVVVSKGQEPMNLVLNEEDLGHEEEILRNPHSIKPWIRYIEHKADAPRTILNLIFERALKELPGSYKLWYNYLKVRRKQMKNRVVTDPGYDAVNNCFERALVFMHKMPRIWIDYVKFLTKQGKVSNTRRVCDRALRALPPTQNDRIWPLYIKFVTAHPIPETAVRVFRRYLQMFPEHSEQFVDYLITQDRLDEASQVMAKIVNNQDFVSRAGKSNHQLWNELCDMISKNPTQIKGLNVDAIIRGGLRKYTDQVGHLWNSLADFYIRSGLFERARDIYEESIQTVTTVRDFTQVFDAYAQFEELALTKKMEEAAESEAPGEEMEVEIELRMGRFEGLMDRRPLLLNSVLLRQNPHNVPEWQKRVELLEGRPRDVVNTFTEAVQTIDPKQAIGKLSSLWINFAKFYEKNKQPEDARVIFEKATHVAYIKVEELAAVWCEWVEMELRLNKFDEGLKLLQRATAPPPRKVSYHDVGETVQMRLHKSLKIWSLYADLEESFGTFKSTKAVYDRILDLKIATPQIIINYGLFLKENNYFEEAFKAYEKGIALFKWPNVYDIWNTYLSEFLARYGGTKLERTRDLFEQCLDECPEQYTKNIYLLYAKLEEEHGMARHAMAVYDRAVAKVGAKEQADVYNIYLRKAAEIYGVTRTRQIYEKAIETLKEADSRNMCTRFAEMETKLGEIDRARAIYSHASQMCDPRVTADFWQTWKDFEVSHGNEDTLREMLRIKRSVQAVYNTQVNMMASAMMADTPAGTGTIADLAPTMTMGLKDDMRRLEAMGAASDAKAKSTAGLGNNIMFVRGDDQSKAVQDMQAADNPDEIDISEDEEEEEEAEGDGEPPKKKMKDVEKMDIPDKVFGSLKKPSDE